MKVNTKTTPGNAKPLTGSDNTTMYKTLSVSSPPTTPHSVVNKEYLDTNYAPVIDTTGDIRFTLTPQTPNGYLRCNGGSVSKSLYSDLYNVIGDSFFPSVRTGSGKPHIHQYEFNTTLSREFYNWTSGSWLTSITAYMDCVVTKNKVYMIGRYSGAVYSTMCYVASINVNGILGLWSTTSSLPGKTAMGEAIIVNNRIYYIGGYDGSSGRNTIYRANVDSNGTMSGWTTYTTMPFSIYRSQAIVTKNKLYLIGGVINGVSSNLVYYSDINSNGDLGTWMSGPPLPVDIHDHSVTVIKNKVYVVGGSSADIDSKYCWIGTLDSQGGIINWMAGESLPETVRLANIVAVRNRVYLIGGIVAGSGSSKVHSSAIAADGSLDGWTVYGDLPVSFYAGSVILTSKALYTLGGYRSGLVSSRTDYVDTTGGLDDYSVYYGDGVYPTNPDTFTLPDYAKLESDNNLYAFVKT